MSSPSLGAPNSSPIAILPNPILSFGNPIALTGSNGHGFGALLLPRRDVLGGELASDSIVCKT